MEDSLKRVDIAIRFADVYPIWQAINERPDGVIVTCSSAGRAIHTQHRLHACRAALRGQEGSHFYDSWVCRVRDCTVEIVRRPTLDFTQLSDIHGNPITPEEIYKSEADRLAEAERSIAALRDGVLDHNQPLVETEE